MSLHYLVKNNKSDAACQVVDHTHNTSTTGSGLVTHLLLRKTTLFTHFSYLPYLLPTFPKPLQQNTTAWSKCKVSVASLQFLMSNFLNFRKLLKLANFCQVIKMQGGGAFLRQCISILYVQ